MIKHAIYVALAFLLAAVFWAWNTYALDQIIRPYQSARSAGMGSVRITTGLYDENFFGNPARVTENPKWRVQLPDFMVESTAQTISAARDIVGGSDDMLTKVANTAGDNLHGRLQTTFPGVYIPGPRWSWGFAFIHSTQFDITLRRSFNISPQAISDVGPALNVGRKLLKDDRLSVGGTLHATYRIASEKSFSTIDLLQGKSPSPSKSGSDGAHIDLDLGATYRIPNVQPLGFELSAGAAVNNSFGGNYSNLNLSYLDTGKKPPPQRTSYGAGIAARRPALWKFTDSVLAFELTDIGNNTNGSWLRTVHIGAELKYGVFRPRGGINQGYLTAGLGIEWKIFSLDLATYGEEMSLNPGGQEDRRYVLRWAFFI